MTTSTKVRIRWLVGLIGLALVITSCGLVNRDDARVEATGGEIQRGRELARTHGCVVCHSIPGISSVGNGYGPDLDGFPDNRLIAGSLENTPENLLAFLMAPGDMVPGTSMPSVGITEDEARDIASWLYSLED